MPLPVPHDVYFQPIDFTALSLKYPSFAAKLKSNRQLDFSDPESVRQLTLSLLHRDFDLRINLPDDRLCPPVPNRFNYILFLSRLLASTSPSFNDSEAAFQKRDVVGLDIGTGASAIYPLLGCRQFDRWKFVATEVDDQSRAYASNNIARNELSSRIKFVPTSNKLIPWPSLEAAGITKLDFVMTNPPFYSSEKQMDEGAKAKKRPPNSACTGAPVEMICKGGEVAFVSKIIEESQEDALRIKIQWFTSMLGKLSSLAILIEKLRAASCTNYAVTEFIQGQKTRRWCLAWSWQNLRAPSSIARNVPALEKKLLPFPPEYDIEVEGDANTIGEAADSILEQLEDESDDRVSWQWKPSMSTGLTMVKEDCWSRKARRRRRMADSDMRDVGDAIEDENAGDSAIGEAAMVTKVMVQEDSRKEKGAGVVVEMRWVQGQDSVLFESFCGWFKRKLEAR